LHSAVKELTRSFETQWEVPILRKVVMNRIPYSQAGDYGMMYYMNGQISDFIFPAMVVLREE
jgi:hypothetical protein